MVRQSLRDQRGIAMLMELVLVALVLTLVGVALYQSNHQLPKDASNTIQSQLTSPEKVADAASKLMEHDSADDVAASAAMDDTADELSAASDDAQSLEGSFDENSF